LTNPTSNSNKKTETFIAKPRKLGNSEIGNVVFVNYMIIDELKMYTSHSVWGYLTKFWGLQTLQYSSN
jgi:hypothetical protein